MRGRCPHRPQQGASPLHLLQEGHCPSALRAFTPRSPLGRGARVNLAPCGVAYGASHAARGRGRVRALLAPYPPSLRSVRYRSHPLQLHRGSIRRAYHDVVSRFGVADRRRRLDLDTSRAQNANAPEGKDNRLFPPAQRRAIDGVSKGAKLLWWGVGRSPAGVKGTPLQGGIG